MRRRRYYPDHPWIPLPEAKRARTKVDRYVVGLFIGLSAATVIGAIVMAVVADWSESPRANKSNSRHDVPGEFE